MLLLSTNVFVCIYFLSWLRSRHFVTKNFIFQDQTKTSVLENYQVLLLFTVLHLNFYLIQMSETATHTLAYSYFDANLQQIINSIAYFFSHFFFFLFVLLKKSFQCKKLQSDKNERAFSFIIRYSERNRAKYNVQQNFWIQSKMYCCSSYTSCSIPNIFWIDISGSHANHFPCSNLFSQFQWKIHSVWCLNKTETNLKPKIVTYLSFGFQFSTELK